MGSNKCVVSDNYQKKISSLNSTYRVTSIVWSTHLQSVITAVNRLSGILIDGTDCFKGGYVHLHAINVSLGTHRCKLSKWTARLGGIKPTSTLWFQ